MTCSTNIWGLSPCPDYPESDSAIVRAAYLGSEELADQPVELP
jgi:hypothetical protein